MPLHYVRVHTVTDNFSPVIRPTGNMVVIGTATAGTANTAVEVSTFAEATKAFSADTGGPSPLTKSLITAMSQSPSPSRLWGIKLGTNIADALTVVEALDVQFVVFAETPLTTDTAKPGAAIAALRDHVARVSDTGDGKERMGVAMLTKGVFETSLVTGSLVDDRMVYVAHQSDQDAAAAVAATIAGYPPHVSMVLKQVAIETIPFTNAQIDTINGTEPDNDPRIVGQGVVWLAKPALLGGKATYLGEGYTGKPLGKKFIDVQRTIDDVTFRLKARLMGAIGNLRISRSGLRALVVTMESVLNPLVDAGVLEGYRVTIPILNLLDADPATLTDTQVQAVRDAHTGRVAQVLASVEYAGAMHRIDINLKFN